MTRMIVVDCWGEGEKSATPFDSGRRLGWKFCKLDEISIAKRSEGRARCIDAFYTHQSKLEEQETRFPVHHRGTDMSLVFDSIYSATPLFRQYFFSAQCC